MVCDSAGTHHSRLVLHNHIYCGYARRRLLVGGGLRRLRREINFYVNYDNGQGDENY